MKIRVTQSLRFFSPSPISMRMAAQLLTATTGKRVLLGVLMLLAHGPTWAERSITQILPTSLPQQGTQVVVEFNGAASLPQTYQLQQPSRLVLDFDGVQPLAQKKSIAVNSAEASAIELSADAQRARLSIQLNGPNQLSHRIEGNRYILKLQPQQLAQALQSSDSVRPENRADASNRLSRADLAKPMPVAATSKQDSPTQQGVRHIGFQRGKDAEAQVLIELLGAKTPVDIQQQGSKVILRVLNHPLSAALQQRLNVEDFATLVSNIDAYNQDGHGMISIQAHDDYEYMAYQTDRKLMISLKPKQSNAAQRELKNGPAYRGKKISLDFQDIEVRRVLQVLAEFTGVNMVAADSVQGNISLRLKDVPWDQALDLILKAKGLDQRRKGNAIWIAPMTEMIKSEEEEAKLQEQSAKSAALHTEYIQLKYAMATEIEKLIQHAQSAQGKSDSSKTQSDNNGSMLSSRGSISIDPRTNTLILTDSAKKIEQIRRMIDLLDVPMRQVMIEARIVRASTDFSKEMGVKWGMLSKGSDLLVGGSDSTLWDLRKPPRDTSRGGSPYTITRPDNLNIDLGVSGAGSSKIAFGLISLSDFMLDLELSALQADGYGEVISTPKVMTADKQKARVAAGQQVPYQARENAGGVSSATTSFKDALLSLDVTPSITPDGKVQMQLNISSDSPAGVAPNGELILNKNEITTHVLVHNGETVVLGGIFEQETHNKHSKVPFMGDLPVLGRLFRRDEKSDKKSELLIFVTPRIVNDSLIRNH